MFYTYNFASEFEFSFDFIETLDFYIEQGYSYDEAYEMADDDYKRALASEAEEYEIWFSDCEVREYEDDADADELAIVKHMVNKRGMTKTDAYAWYELFCKARATQNTRLVNKLLAQL